MQSYQTYEQPQKGWGKSGGGFARHEPYAEPQTDWELSTATCSAHGKVRSLEHLKEGQYGYECTPEQACKGATLPSFNEVGPNGFGGGGGGGIESGTEPGYKSEFDSSFNEVGPNGFGGGGGNESGADQAYKSGFDSSFNEVGPNGFGGGGGEVGGDSGAERATKDAFRPSFNEVGPYGFGGGGEGFGEEGKAEQASKSTFDSSFNEVGPSGFGGGGKRRGWDESGAEQASKSTFDSSFNEVGTNGSGGRGGGRRRGGWDESGAEQASKGAFRTSFNEVGPNGFGGGGWWDESRAEQASQSAHRPRFNEVGANGFGGGGSHRWDQKPQQQGNSKGQGKNENAMTALCTTHQKMRLKQAMQDDGFGNFSCIEGSDEQCKGRAGPNPNLMSNGGAEMTGPAVCSAHGKTRIMKVMESDGLGGFKCMPGEECKVSAVVPSGSSLLPAQTREKITAVCALHDKTRRIDVMDNSSGVYTCTPGNECKVGTAGLLTNTMDPSTGLPVPLENGLLPSQTVICSSHHKRRSAAALMSDGMGNYCCRPDMACKVQGSAPQHASGRTGGQVLCQAHGKIRSLMSVQDNGMGVFICRFDSMCK